MGINVPPGTDELTVLSLYAPKPPSYFDIQSWPPIGYPSSYGAGTIPAQTRFTNNSYTVCHMPSPCPDSLEVNQIGYDNAIFQSEMSLSLEGAIYPFQDIHLQAGEAVEFTAGAYIWQGAEVQVKMEGCP